MKNKTLLLTIILLLSTLAVTSFPVNVKAQEAGKIEVSSSTFSQFSVLEIRVYDPDIARSNATMPEVKVKTGYDVYTVKMYQSVEGYWFGYIRVWSWIDRHDNNLWDPDEPIIIDLDKDGKCSLGDFNVTANSFVTNPTGEDLEGVIPQNPPKQDATLGSGEVLWTKDFKSVTSIYANPGEKITIEYYDENPPGVRVAEVFYITVEGRVRFDRGVYPEKAKVYLTVEDPDLNQDPTIAESYTLNPASLNFGAKLKDLGGILSVYVNDKLTFPNLTITETGPNTGTFTTTIPESVFRPPAVIAPATLTANYTDYSSSALPRLPDPDKYSVKKGYASVVTYTGKVSFDKSIYRIGESVTVKVEDPDLNVDSKVKDTTTYGGRGSLWITSTTDPLGFPIILVETDVNTGIFVGNFTLSLSETIPPDVLKVSSGDYIYANYTDEKNAAGVENYAVTAIARFKTFTANVTLDRSFYGPLHIGKVTIYDPDENIDFKRPDIIPYTENIVTVKSSWVGGTSGPWGITLVETGDNTNKFVGFFVVSPWEEESGSTPTVKAPPGASLTLVYNERIDEYGGLRPHVLAAICKTFRGNVTLDKPVYSPGRVHSTSCLVPEHGGLVTVNVLDPDLNRNVDAVDFYRETNQTLLINVLKPDGTARAPYPIWLNLTETGNNTGVFFSKHWLSSSVKTGDMVEVKYLDKFDESGKPLNITVKAPVRTHSGILSVSSITVHPGGKITVTVRDEDWNLNPYIKDVIPAGNVGDWGGVDVLSTFPGATGTQIVLVETEPNSGIFTGEVKLGRTIQADAGDTITIRYNDEQDANGNGVRLVEKVKVSATTGEITLNKQYYPLSGVVEVEVKDPDRNKDPSFAESIGVEEVTIKSTSQTIPVNLDKPLIETGPDTGIFRGSFQLKSILEAQQPPVSGVCYVAHDDWIVVTYIDPIGEDNVKEIHVTAKAQIKQTTAKLSFDKTSYMFNDTAIITLVDPDLNEESTTIEFVNVNVFSSTDLAGVSIVLAETGPNTGVFKGEVRFADESIGSKLKVNVGDIVTAKYVDKNPSPSDVPGWVKDTPIPFLEVTAKATIGLAAGIPPVDVSTPTLLDFQGRVVGKVIVDLPIVISSNLTNNAFEDLSLLYIVQVKDADGRVVYLSFISGTVPAQQSYTYGLQWQPEKSGIHTIEIYVWKSWLEPRALSKVVSLSVIVFPL